MSWDGYVWARQLRLPAIPKIITIMLANRVDAKGECANYPLEELAADAGVHLATADRYLAVLQQRGILAERRRRYSPSGAPLCTQYRLNIGFIPDPQEGDPPPPRERGGGSVLAACESYPRRERVRQAGVFAESECNPGAERELALADSKSDPCTEREPVLAGSGPSTRREIGGVLADSETVKGYQKSYEKDEKDGTDRARRAVFSSKIGQNKETWQTPPGMTALFAALERYGYWPDPVEQDRIAAMMTQRAPHVRDWRIVIGDTCASLDGNGGAPRSNWGAFLTGWVAVRADAMALANHPPSSGPQRGDVDHAAAPLTDDVPLPDAPDEEEASPLPAAPQPAPRPPQPEPEPDREQHRGNAPQQGPAGLLWAEIGAQLRRGLKASDWDTWLADGLAAGLDGDVLTIELPTDAADWIQRKGWGATAEAIAAQAAGRPITIRWTAAPAVALAS